LSANPKYFELAVILLSWLIDELHKELSEELSNAELEIIADGFMGKHPILGVHYETTRYDSSLEDLIERTIDKIIRDSKIERLIRYIVRDDKDWSVETQKIMDDQ